LSRLSLRIAVRPVCAFELGGKLLMKAIMMVAAFCGSVSGHLLGVNALLASPNASEGHFSEYPTNRALTIGYGA
jgi:hypothetical protein